MLRQLLDNEWLVQGRHGIRSGAPPSDRLKVEGCEDGGKAICLGFKGLSFVNLS